MHHTIISSVYIVCWRLLHRQIRPSLQCNTQMMITVQQMLMIPFIVICNDIDVLLLLGTTRLFHLSVVSEKLIPIHVGKSSNNRWAVHLSSFVTNKLHGSIISSLYITRFFWIFHYNAKCQCNFPTLRKYFFSFFFCITKNKNDEIV